MCTFVSPLGAMVNRAETRRKIDRALRTGTKRTGSAEYHVVPDPVLGSNSMALGNIGKTLAGQAIDAVKKNALDAVRPETGKIAEKPAEKNAAQPESPGAVILGQIQAMQRLLKDDQELVISYESRTETLRVLEIFVPSVHVLVLAGMDDENHVTRVIVPAATLQLVCKVKNVLSGSAPVRVNILTPKPRTEEKAPDQRT